MLSVCRPVTGVTVPRRGWRHGVCCTSQRVVDEGEYVEFRVHVVTGHRLGSSTQAPVHMVLVGDRGRSPNIPLDQSKTHKVSFQKGQEDIFDVACCDVGPLRKIGIGHGSKQTKDGWFLAKVSVISRKHSLEYTVPCETWLSAVEGATFKEFPIKSSSPYEGDWDEVPHYQDYGDPHIRPVTSKQGRSSPPSDHEPSQGPQLPEDNEKEDSSKRIMTLDEYKSGAPPQTTPRGQRRDDFFDQHVRDKDYSSVIETLSSTTDQDNRDDFSKPGDSRQRDSNYRYDLSVDRNDRDKEKTELVLRVEGEGLKEEGRREEGRQEREEEERVESQTGDQFMDGFKAGIEAAQKSQEVSVATTARSSGEEEEEEEESWRKGPSAHEAAETGDLEQLKKLAQHSPQSKLQVNDNGWQPLHVAASAGQLEVVQWLTVNVVDLDVMTPTGYTPMHVAAANGHTNCMMVLAAMGAKIDACSVDERTPLHLAASCGHLESCKWLVSNRADISARDMSGRRAVELARDSHQVEVEKLLTACEQDQTTPDSGLAQLRSRTPSLTHSDAGGRRVSKGEELYGVPEEDERPWTDDQPPKPKPSSNPPPTRHESGTDDSSDDSTDSSSTSGSYTESQTTDYSSSLSAAQKKRHDQELMRKRELYKQQQAARKNSSFLEDIQREVESGERAVTLGRRTISKN